MASATEKTTMKVTSNEATREQLMNAHHALWAINLRAHRGDPGFRDEIHRLRDETAVLIEALDNAEGTSGPF